MSHLKSFEHRLEIDAQLKQRYKRSFSVDKKEVVGLLDEKELNNTT